MSNTIRWTPEQFQAHLDRQKAAAPRAVVSVSPKATRPVGEPVDKRKPVSAKEKVQALGRLAPGEQNGTEKEYDALLARRLAAGEIVWYAFECVTFVLPGGVRFTPDFMVQLASGEVEIHEVKGHWTDDARVKIRLAAGVFPLFRFIAFRKRAKKRGGGFEQEEF